jgi:hypothetical protein
MNVTQLIALIRSEIARLRSVNEESVTIASLETLLATVENQLAQQSAEPTAAGSAIEHEHARLQNASKQAQFEARERMRAELFKSVITSAEVLIRSLILINGGAAVALLAFIGHLASTKNDVAAIIDPSAAIHAFACPLLCFVFGVLGAALFAGFVAAAQKLYAEEFNQRTIDAQRGQRLKRRADACVWFIILFALCSVVAFATGSCLAYLVFATM